MTKIACSITPHGFGHATRMTAVLEALHKRIPDLLPHLYTTVTESLFAETLNSFKYHPLCCDIGLVQKDGLHTDLPQTIHRLQEFLPFNDSLVKDLAQKIQGCKLVLCDIAPLGIAVAKEAGIPSVLIENFTWDWIYKAYVPAHPAIRQAINYFKSVQEQADIHIRCTPCCSRSYVDLECAPIFRSKRLERMEMRDQLHCTNKKLLFITMGGIDTTLPFFHKLSATKNIFFIVAGQQETCHLAENVLLIGKDSEYYHPDIINAADLVVCKSGYSTVAECFQAGVSIVTVGRATFPESKILEQFCATHLNGQTIQQQDFLSGDWLKNLQSIFSENRPTPSSLNGADTVADYLCRNIFKTT